MRLLRFADNSFLEPTGAAAPSLMIAARNAGPRQLKNGRMRRDDTSGRAGITWLWADHLTSKLQAQLHGGWLEGTTDLSRPATSQSFSTFPAPESSLVGSVQ